jgi:F0F1-type ATP synthase delta subunit
MPLSRKLATYLISGKITLDDVVVLLTKYKLLTLLPSVKQALVQMSTSVQKHQTMTIESPFSLSDQSLQKIKGMTKNPEAPHRVVINKNILAGFKATYQGIMYDGSAERIIKQLMH